MNKENRKYIEVSISHLSLIRTYWNYFIERRALFLYLKLAAEQLSLKAFQGTLNLNDSNAADQV